MAENAVIAQKNKQVGDDNIADPVEVKVTPTDEQADAQVAQPREKDASKVTVNEVSVVTDEVITDPSDPRAVQVPDAGRGDASTPIANAYRDGERVEDVFAREASEANSDEDDSDEPTSPPAS